MASSKFVIDTREIKRGLQVFDERIHRRMLAASGFHAERAQATMRSNAPWTDRTSNARNGLFAQGFYTPGPDDHSIYGVVLYHSVPYGIWLETRWAGRFAAIAPVLSSEGKQFMLTVATLFASIAG